jgi:hypothetical protein
MFDWPARFAARCAVSNDARSKTLRSCCAWARGCSASFRCVPLQLICWIDNSSSSFAPAAVVKAHGRRLALDMTGGTFTLSALSSFQLLQL